MHTPSTSYLMHGACLLLLSLIRCTIFLDLLGSMARGMGFHHQDTLDLQINSLLSRVVHTLLTLHSLTLFYDASL